MAWCRPAASCSSWIASLSLRSRSLALRSKIPRWGLPLHWRLPDQKFRSIRHRLVDLGHTSRAPQLMGRCSGVDQTWRRADAVEVHAGRGAPVSCLHDAACRPGNGTRLKVALKEVHFARDVRKGLQYRAGLACLDHPWIQPHQSSHCQVPQISWQSGSSIEDFRRLDVDVASCAARSPIGRKRYTHKSCAARYIDMRQARASMVSKFPRARARRRPRAVL